MAAGRLVFGLGAESLIVAVTTIMGKWFKGKELSFAFGLNLIRVSPKIRYMKRE
jgi:hypothetical protein